MSTVVLIWSKPILISMAYTQERNSVKMTKMEDDKCFDGVEIRFENIGDWQLFGKIFENLKNQVCI